MADEPRLSVESIAGQRPYQEDAVLARSLSDGRVLVAVADGMGGHAAGEVASALALETLVSALEDGEEFDAAFRLANARVFEKAKEPGKNGMGTTLVAALVEEGEYLVANVGDSRAYLLTADGIRQITDDHSFVAEAVKRGQSLREAMATPWRDALTRSIGTEGQVEVDVFGPFPVRDPSALLICSDGLYKTLSDEDLRQIFVQSPTPEAGARALVSEAFERGSDDNISVTIAEYGEIPRSAAQSTMQMDFIPPAADDLGAVTSATSTDADQGSVVAEEVRAEAATTLELEPIGSDAPTLELEPVRVDDGDRGDAALAAKSGPPWVAIAAAVVTVAVLLAVFLSR